MKSQDIILSIKRNDNIALQHIYVKCGPHCISKLRSKRNCSIEDAEDLFIDAVIIFRENVLRNKISELSNVSSYLFTICDNIFLAKLKKEQSNKSKYPEIKDIFYPDEFSGSDESRNEEILNATKKAWSQLKENCKDILSYFYVDHLRMKEISELMGFANSDVAKTTKSRCYKHFMKAAHEIYQSNKKSYAE